MRTPPKQARTITWQSKSDESVGESEGKSKQRLQFDKILLRYVVIWQNLAQYEVHVTPLRQRPLLWDSSWKCQPRPQQLRSTSAANKLETACYRWLRSIETASRLLVSPRDQHRSSGGRFLQRERKTLTYWVPSALCLSSSTMGDPVRRRIMNENEEKGGGNK